MFIVLLKFSRNKARAGQFMDGHKEWIKRGFDDGVFLLAGSLQPNLGGAIAAAFSRPNVSAYPVVPHTNDALRSGALRPAQRQGWASGTYVCRRNSLTPSAPLLAVRSALVSVPNASLRFRAVFSAACRCSPGCDRLMTILQAVAQIIFLIANWYRINSSSVFTR